MLKSDEIYVLDGRPVVIDNILLDRVFYYDAGRYTCLPVWYFQEYGVWQG